MSSIESRRNPVSGTESHRVRFRHGGTNKAVTFATREAAESWRSVLDGVGPARALALLEEERPVTTRTVADQVDHHIAHLTGVTEGTKRRYAHIADDRIRPHFARTLLSDLTRDGVAEWLNAVRLGDDEPPAPKTLRNWHGLLSAALSSAVDAGLIPTNPAYRMRLPRIGHEREEMVFLTQEEFATLHDLIPEPYRPLVLLLVGTGVRWGEATALQVKHLDRATHSARIRQAWKHTEGVGRQLGPPKSPKSRRTVAVPDPVFAALEDRMRLGPDAFVAVNRRGDPILSGTFHGRTWQPTVRKFQALTGKKPRVHDLRHTFASWAIQRNVPLPVIQRQMGHESITTTVDLYGHLARSDFDPLLSMGAETLPRTLPAIES